jgi:hypothetical protein
MLQVETRVGLIFAADRNICKCIHMAYSPFLFMNRSM